MSNSCAGFHCFMKALLCAAQQISVGARMVKNPYMGIMQGLYGSLIQGLFKEFWQQLLWKDQNLPNLRKRAFQTAPAIAHLVSWLLSLEGPSSPANTSQLPLLRFLFQLGATLPKLPQPSDYVVYIETWCILLATIMYYTHIITLRRSPYTYQTQTNTLAHMSHCQNSLDTGS